MKKPANIFSSVLKRNGQVQPFSKDKIIQSINLASEKVGSSNYTLAEHMADRTIIFLSKNTEVPPLHVDMIRDAVIKVLIENGQTSIAKIFMLHKAKKDFIKKALDEDNGLDTGNDDVLPDTSRFKVIKSDESIQSWDRNMIVEALMRETGIKGPLAEQVSKEVELELTYSRIKNITSALVREMVNAKLIEYGLEEEYRLHARLGIPFYDAEQILLSPASLPTTALPHPDNQDRNLADTINRQFALAKVFSPEVTEAHLKSTIHIHNLGQVTRPHQLSISLAYLQKYGLNIPGFIKPAGPARHPESLLAHMKLFGSAVRGYTNRPIVWEDVNVLFSPYLENKNTDEIENFAEKLLFDTGYQAIHNPALGTEHVINLSGYLPGHLTGPAIGPAGEYTGKPYSDYLKTTEAFTRAIWKVIENEEILGKPLLAPRLVLQLNREETAFPLNPEILSEAARLAGKTGVPIFSFQDHRPKEAEAQLEMDFDRGGYKSIPVPEERYSVLVQDVTVNLGQAGLENLHGHGDINENIDKALKLAVSAHEQKWKFISRLLAQGPKGALGIFTAGKNTPALLSQSSAVFSISLAGFSELVYMACGQKPGEGKEAGKKAAQLAAYLKMRLEQLARPSGLKIVLGSLDDPMTLIRLTDEDRRRFPKLAEKFIDDGAAVQNSYSPDISISNYSKMQPFKRLFTEADLQKEIGAGFPYQFNLGKQELNREIIEALINDARHHSTVGKLLFTPEITLCLECYRVSPGLLNKCPVCENDYVENFTRLAGDYIRLSHQDKKIKALVYSRFRGTIPLNPVRNDPETDQGLFD